MAAGAGGFRILNIADPRNMFQVSELLLPSGVEARGVFKRDNLVYMAVGTAGLKIIDVSDPFLPIEAGALANLSDTRGVFLKDNLAYLASYSGGLYCVDISDVVNPFEVAHFGLQNEFGKEVLVEGADLLALDLLAGLSLYDVADPLQPVLRKQWAGYGVPQNIDMKDDLAAMANFMGGWLVMDTSDPTQLQPLSSAVADSCHRVWWHGDNLFVMKALTKTLKVYDLAVPADPIFVADYVMGSRAEDMAFHNNYAFAACGSDGLIILDISNRQAISETASLDIFNYATQIFFNNDAVFVLDDIDELITVIDVSDVVQPGVLNLYPTGGTGQQKMSFRSPYLILAGGTNRLSILDVSIPTNIFEVGRVNGSGGSVNKLAVSGNFIYYIGGIQFEVYDFSTPFLPVRIGPSITFSEYSPNCISALDDKVLIGGGGFPRSALYSLTNTALTAIAPPQETVPATAILLQNYPNPFNPETTISYQLAEPADIQLSVYNLAGQIVRTLIERESMSAGRYSLHWDGCNNAGNPVASGLYFYSLSFGERSITRKMLLVR